MIEAPNLPTWPSGAPPRLCVVETQDFAFWTHRHHLGHAALRAGMEVHVIAPGGDRARRIRDGGFHYHELVMERAGTNPLTEARAVSHLVALYRRIRPDIVHHVALKAILNGSIAARLARVPAVVGSLTGLGYTFMPGGPGRAVLREIVCLGLGFALRGSRVHTIFQNPDDRELFVRRRLVNAARTSIVLGSGVDTRRFSPTPEPAGPPVVAFGSRMLWDKGIAELVEALRTLRREGVSFRARFAGTPDTSNPATVSERELKAWQAEGLIEWRGYVDDMAAFLAAAHVACLPSYREGLPLFLAEAAASGRPCVTTDVPGCRSVVIDGSTGYVVPARQAAALTHALRRLLTEPALRAKQGKAARELALESLSAERVVSDTFNVYRRLLEEARN